MIDRLPLPDEWKTALKEGFSLKEILDALPGVQEILGTFAQFIPGMDKYIEDGALKKVPNLLLHTTTGLHSCYHMWENHFAWCLVDHQPNQILSKEDSTC